MFLLTSKLNSKCSSMFLSLSLSQLHINSNCSTLTVYSCVHRSAFWSENVMYQMMGLAPPRAIFTAPHIRRFNIIWRYIKNFESIKIKCEILHRNCRITKNICNNFWVNTHFYRINFPCVYLKYGLFESVFIHFQN